jgi:hypothetical protein
MMVICVSDGDDSVYGIVGGVDFGLLVMVLQQRKKRLVTQRKNQLTCLRSRERDRERVDCAVLYGWFSSSDDNERKKEGTLLETSHFRMTETVIQVLVEAPFCWGYCVVTIHGEKVKRNSHFGPIIAGVRIALGLGGETVIFRRT